MPHQRRPAARFEIYRVQANHVQKQEFYNRYGGEYVDVGFGDSPCWLRITAPEAEKLKSEGYSIAFEPRHNFMSVAVFR